ARHALARVERDAEAHRHAVRTEMRHGLRLVVFVDEEIVLAQPGHEAAVRIDHCRRDVDQFDAALEAESRIGILPRLRRRRWLPLRRDGGDRDRHEQEKGWSGARHDRSPDYLACAIARSRRSTCGTT